MDELPIIDQDTYRRGVIQALENAMRQCDDQIEIPTEHYFSKGLYARAVRIPKGAVVTGKIHKFHCFNVVANGAIEVATEEGTQLYVAGDVIVSPPGIKRAVYAVTDVVWITVHATEAASVEEAEAELVVDRYEDLPAPLRAQLEAK